MHNALPVARAKNTRGKGIPIRPMRSQTGDGDAEAEGVTLAALNSFLCLSSLSLLCRVVTVEDYAGTEHHHEDSSQI